MIVTRTLAANEQAIYSMAGSGFSIVAASGAINVIEFLRQGKVIEDLLGTFGQGFYFKAPDGTIYDGVRFRSFSGGTFSVFIGYGVAGILEPDNARAVDITNSSIGVDVKNSILNTNVSNSSLNVDVMNSILNTNVSNSSLNVDVKNATLNTSISNSSLNVDITTPSVTVDPNEVGVTALVSAPQTISSAIYSGNTANLTLVSGNIATIRVQGEFNPTTAGELTYATQIDVLRNGVSVFTKFIKQLQYETNISPYIVDFDFNSSTLGTAYWSARVTYTSPVGGPVTVRNLRIKVSL
jgi:hypothetical protein